MNENNIQISSTQSLLLPPFHATKEEFVTAAKIWAKKYNFFLSTDKSGIDRVVLVCVKGGRQRNVVSVAGEGGAAEASKTRTTSSKTIKCNCPFKLTGRKQKNGLWKAMFTNKIHNHPPMTNNDTCISNIPQERQMALETKKIEILRLYNEDQIPPRQIMSSLGLTNVVKMKDIYNIIAAAKRKKLVEEEGGKEKSTTTTKEDEEKEVETLK